MFSYLVAGTPLLYSGNPMKEIALILSLCFLSFNIAELCVSSRDLCDMVHENADAMRRAELSHILWQRSASQQNAAAKS